MWLPALVCHARAFYAALDLGSQYVRIAINTIKDPARLVANDQNKVLTPSAIALKLPHEICRHLTLAEASRAEVKIGEAVLKVLKGRPAMGSAFLPRLIGRSFSTELQMGLRISHDLTLCPSSMRHTNPSFS
jgi:molecular chaperone DnaK (HSP70)